MKTRVVVLVSIAALVPGVSAGQQNVAARPASNFQAMFAAANTAASRGEHVDAIRRYQELVAAGVRDPDVYFNLATALAQSGDYPRAIFNYERALALRPGDEKAADNLRDAEQALEEARAVAEGEASIRRASSISDALYRRFTEDGLAYALLTSNVLFFAALAWAWARRRRGQAFYALLLSSAALLLFSAGGLAVKVGLLRDGPRAVVLEDRIALREGPDPRARVRGEARGGDRAQLVGRDRDYVKLRIAGGPEGWAPEGTVGAIDREDGAH
jgi:tetratricopeptide (TPR) repeat protein